jgi:flagellar hook-basal body complex protein FliE
MSINIQGPGVPFDSVVPAQPGSGNQSGFADVLREGMRQIDQLQGDAQTKTEQLLKGDGQDVHSAMIAVQKAELSFQLMMQVRNKIVQAYQDVSKMAF